MKYVLNLNTTKLINIVVFDSQSQTIWYQVKWNKFGKKCECEKIQIEQIKNREKSKKRIHILQIQKNITKEVDTFEWTEDFDWFQEIGDKHAEKEVPKLELLEKYSISSRHKIFWNIMTTVSYSLIF